MSAEPATANSRAIILLIKSAYWIALLIIAAMALASFILLQKMINSRQSDGELLTIVSMQRALSQRIVFLANTIDSAEAERQPPLVVALRAATEEFEKNYDLLLEKTGATNDPEKINDPDSVEHILFAKPYHLDYFSLSLAANGWRFISAFETRLNMTDADHRYLAGRERARLDETVASTTLDGYTALHYRLDKMAVEQLDNLMSVHRILFYATILVILLVALFIFRPMSKAILRRTRELMDARNSMAFLTVHDGLTGLYNRAYMTNHFDALLSTAQRRQERLAVVQIDLDRFKQINDTLGHSAGDYVLVVTAQRLRDCCRASDLCIRLGGDEFAMILSGAGSTEDINTVAERILDAINEPINFKGSVINPDASAGIAVYPVDADNASDLIVHADLALYAAKKQGGGMISFFSEELRGEVDHRKRVERDLVVGIETEAFVPYFQPQVSISSGQVVGVEVLVRWKHPEYGIVPPGGFIPVAEKSGLMVDIGRIVRRKAIKAAADWHQAGIEFGRLAVNVSGVELVEPDFDRILFEDLHKFSFPVEKLALEIVESVILDDEKTGIAATLRHIRATGIHLELDDFGTGYASLSHVDPNEIDRLKIDRRFVQNIDAEQGNAKIVKAVTELANGLGISVVAEGAETQAELDCLSRLGCDQVQGYAIAFPMPAEQARDWLLSAKSKQPKLAISSSGRA
jgi:diguanylate cyclase (GGDEF)-like protein